MVDGFNDVNSRLCVCGLLNKMRALDTVPRAMPRAASLNAPDAGGRFTLPICIFGDGDGDVDVNGDIW